jgi:hypothetical protein
MTEQVLTRAECLLEEKDFLDQRPVSIHNAVSGVVRHLYVSQKETDVDIKPAPQPIQRESGKGARKGTGRRKKKRQTKPRQGGWASTKCISRELHRETRTKAGLLSLLGYRFTVFATARAPIGLTDGQAKRHVARSFARLGQALERKGHGYIGLNVYEKPFNGFLHGHALLHVRRDCLSIVKRWADRFDERPLRLREQVESVALHARPAVNSDLAYILKQRQFNGPCERPSQPWQRSESFAGTRVSFTKMARAIIEEADRRQLKSERAAPYLAVTSPVAQRIPELVRAA